MFAPLLHPPPPQHYLVILNGLNVLLHGTAGSCYILAPERLQLSSSHEGDNGLTPRLTGIQCNPKTTRGTALQHIVHHSPFDKVGGYFLYAT